MKIYAQWPSLGLLSRNCEAETFRVGGTLSKKESSRRQATVIQSHSGGWQRVEDLLWSWGISYWEDSILQVTWASLLDKLDFTSKSSDGIEGPRAWIKFGSEKKKLFVNLPCCPRKEVIAAIFSPTMNVHLPPSWMSLITQNMWLGSQSSTDP